jgi:replication factor C subunit 2/4
MNNLPIVEKYRPTTLSEIVGNKYEINKLMKFLSVNHIPNIIIEGEPGTGKTSTIFAFIKEYLGDLYDNFCIELNASDDRGIDIVRSKIKIFSQKISEQNKESSNVKKYKIVILDEADNMTPSAQLALRRIMEIHEENTRFVFTCNNIENIIDALQSRCNILHFGNIEKDDIKERLKYISGCESIDIDDAGINAIFDIADNKCDLRQMINILEFVKANSDFSTKKINKEVIYNICDKPSPFIIDGAIKKLDNKEFQESLKTLMELRNSGFSNVDISQTLFNQIKNIEKEKSHILELCEIVGKYIKIFLNSSDTEIQLASLLSDLYLSLHKSI